MFHKAFPLRARELASGRCRLHGVLSIGNSDTLARFLPLNISGVLLSALARGVDVELLPESDGDGSGSRAGVTLSRSSLGREGDRCWCSTLSVRKGLEGDDGGADECRRGDKDTSNGDDSGEKARAELLLLSGTS